MVASAARIGRHACWALGAASSRRMSALSAIRVKQDRRRDVAATVAAAAVGAVALWDAGHRRAPRCASAVPADASAGPAVDPDVELDEPATSSPNAQLALAAARKKKILDGMPFSAKMKMVESRRQIAARDFDAAITSLREAEAILSLTHLEEEVTTVVQLQLANLYYLLQRWEPALNYFKLVVKGYIASGRPADDNAVIEISIKTADCFDRLDRPTEAMAGFSWCVGVARLKAEALAADGADRAALLNSYGMLGLALQGHANHFVKRSLFERALPSCLEALNVALAVTAIDGPTGAPLVVNSHELLASVCNTAGDADAAVFHAREALRIAVEANVPKLYVVQTNLATILGLRHTEAGELLQLALVGATASADREAAEHIMSLIGLLE